MSEELRRGSAGWFWFWLLVTIAFVLFCLWHSTSRNVAGSIPNDVSQRVASILGGTPLASKYRIDGRDVVFEGEVSPQVPVDRLIDQVRANPHTQKVLVGGLRITGGSPATLQLEVYGDSVVLKGELQSQAQVDVLVESVEQQFADATIDNEIVVKPEAINQPWVDQFALFVPELSKASPAVFSATGKRVLISGRVNDPDLKTAINNAASNAFGNSVSIRNDIEIVIPKVPPAIVLQRQGEQIVLTGQLPGRADIQELVRSAVNVYGPDNVDNQLTPSDGVNNASWSVASAELFLTLKAVDEVRAEFIGTTLSVAGVVDSLATKQAVLEALEEIGVVTIAQESIQIIAPDADTEPKDKE